MVLFTILALVLILLVTLTVVSISVIGATGIVLFGDVIVCIFIIGWIIKLLVNRKRKRK